MNSLAKNLGEEYSDVFQCLTTELGETNEHVEMEQGTHVRSSVVTRLATEHSREVKGEEWISIDFSMFLESITLRLFLVSPEKDITPLSVCCFEQFSLLLTVKNSGTTLASLTMKTMEVTDNRAVETYYPTIVETEFDEKCDLEEAFCVKVELGKKGTEIDIAVNSLNFVLYTEFIFCLIEFVSTNSTAVKSADAKADEGEISKATSVVASRERLDNTGESSSATALTVKINMHKSSFALVENFQERNSKAFLLTMTLTSRVILSEEQQNVDVHMANFELLSCRITNEGLTNAFAILKPCSVDLCICMCPEKRHLYFFLDSFIVTVNLC